jgi:hypothetical protein
MASDVGASAGALSRTEVILVAVAAILGAAVWWWAMASAPRYSFGAEQDMGNGLFYPLLLGVALMGGWIVPSRAGLIGLALGAPGMLLSPWTAPRGDNDGLWILVIPFLVAFMLVLALVADLAGRARRRFTGRSN